MKNETKIRLLGYYSQPNQSMNPESERIEEANELAPLLGDSIQSLYQNPETDEELKKVILGATVFVFKDETGNLVAYFTKDKIARVTGVVYNRQFITQVPLKYKSWFCPGQSINLIKQSKDDTSSSIDENINSSSESKRKVPNTTKRERIKSTSRFPQRINREEIEKVKTRLRLENNYFIGQFSPGQDGWYKISDIRNTDFTKIEDKERGIKDLTISFRSQAEFNRFAYYKFTWVLLQSSPLKFGINLREEVVPIYPEDIVRCLHDSIIHYPASAAKKITRTLDTLNKQLTQSGKEVFIYELLQNANDYPRKHKEGNEIVSDPVDVEFHITDKYLTFQHTGDYFNAKNIAAICDINDGEKSDNVEAIGYKGIGFKTVFLDNDYVYLRTGNYSFRFDKAATDIINTPWQILPVWTDIKEVNPAIKNVFKRHRNDIFRVKFALKPRDSRILTDRGRQDNYIDLFSSVFDSERVILFIPNIRKVSIFLNEEREPSIVRKKSSSDWCVSEALTDVIPEKIRNRINDVLTDPDADRSGGYDKVPEKYLNFSKTAVKFACQRNGRKLLPVDNAILYCYLPAKRADWGFKFLMNTDMVPNGPRDDIDDIELNHEIAKIAGRQFFYWIKGLIESKNYELDSVFALIPDFEECKKKRNSSDQAFQSFIKEFENEFETLVKKVPFVPVVDADGNESLACIDKIIDDLTGMTEKNVMSDSDFIRLMEISNYYLPIQELRESQCFMDFLYDHCSSDVDIDFAEVKSKCSSDGFKKWLVDLNNNTRFIKHLLEKDELVDFKSELIFIENEGKLYKAEELYYDFDTKCSSINFLKKYVPHLCDHTRKCTVNNAKWLLFVQGEHFKKFDAKTIIKNYVLEKADAINLLKNLTNSVSFFRFVAENKLNISDVKEKIPYITEDGNAITDYNNRLYFYDNDAYEVSKAIWLGENVINILSHVYLEKDENDSLKTLFEGLGFSSFSKLQFITNVITDDIVFKDTVNKSLDNSFDKSFAFFKYVFSCRDLLKEKNLLFKDYVISCIDINGKETFLCKDDVRYFNQTAVADNSTFEDNKAHVWITNTMMYSLNPKYFDEFDESESKVVESFFRNQFDIKTFTDKSFFNDVVLKNKKIIYPALSVKEKLLAFISYLKRDAAHLFDGSLSYNEVKDMPLLCSDGTVLSERKGDIKLIEYSEAAITLHKKKWCPAVFIVMSEEYSKGFSKDILQLFKIGAFELNEIMTDIINHDSFQGNLNNKENAESTDNSDNAEIIENNVDFWRWIRANAKDIKIYDALKGICLLDTKDNSYNCSSLYISDTYQKDNGIENLVKRYESDALFVSDSYLEEPNDKSRNEWFKLFKKLGLKSDNKDILFNSVLPNLSTFEEDSVVAMMTKHLKDLKAVWTERKSEIVQLKIRTNSGDYKTLDETIIVDVSEEKVSEPFKYIRLSDEVATDIFENNKELLQLISKECSKHLSITNKEQWAEEKIKEYIDHIQTDKDKREAVHVEFVQELARLSADYSFSSELLDKILYRVKGDDESYKSAIELTLGNVYSPVCDFEANGVELDYLSEDYIFESNRDTIKSFFKNRGLHHNVLQDDLQYLSNRVFACYFWSYCFSRRLSEYKRWIDEGFFNDIVCIPTETSVKKAEELYHPDIVIYAVKSKSPGWEEKVPDKFVVDKIENRDARAVFCLLPFNNALSLEDSLNYLLNAKERREDESAYRRLVVNWIVRSENINKALIDEYRQNPDAKWRNGKGHMVHISKLYAIHPESKQERAIFSGDEHVMQTNMFPNETSQFERLCEILQIKCLSSKDFIPTPINPIDETKAMMEILKPRILVLSAIENSSKYKDIYKSYNDIISKYLFFVCDKIDLCYETIHNDVGRVYNNDNKIYYVLSWQHHRTFTKFCACIKRLLGISMLDDVWEDVLDVSVSVEDSIEKYCQSLVYDKDFRLYLENLDCKVSVEEEEEPVTDQEGYYSEVLSTTEPDKEDGSGTDEATPNDTADASVEPTPDVVEDARQRSQFSNQGKEQDVKKPVSSQPRQQQEPQVNSDESDYDDSEDKTDTGVKPTEKPSHSGTSSKSSSSSIDSRNNKEHEPRSTNEETDIPDDYFFDPDQGDLMGSVDMDPDFEPIGSIPRTPRRRRAPRRFTREELERLRSHGSPLVLESLKETEEEIDILAKYGIPPEQIADTNYLAQLRLYQNLIDNGYEPEESEEEFIRNADDVTTHKMKGGKYIHTCSAARGVMYISPSVWNKVVEDKWIICVYLDGRGKNFHYIKSAKEFLDLVEKDDVVIKITGEEKVDVVRALYSGLLSGTKGTAYTLIRVASRTNMDAVFAHYVGAMAEPDDGNDNNEYGL